MRTRSIISNDRSRGGVNVTPMIDVVMCLIVFYLMVGQLATDRRAAVRVPESGSGADTQQRTDALELSVDMDGVVAIGALAIDPDRLEGEIAGRVARGLRSPVRVRADERAPYGSVRPMLDALRGSGIASVEFVTVRAEGGPR